MTAFIVGFVAGALAVPLAGWWFVWLVGRGPST